jgi:LysM repeat protein
MSIAGKRIKVVDKKRLALAVFVIILFMLLLSTGLAQIVRGDEIPVYGTYIVKEGDTLWSIAKDYGSDKIDIRDIVYEISIHNGILGNDHIYPDQRLEIPLR